MKRGIIGLAMLWITIAGHGQTTDGIAAVVGDQPITFSDIRGEMSDLEKKLIGQYKDEADKSLLIKKIKEARSATLNALIERKLIIKEFHNKGFFMPDEVIEDQIFKIVTDNFAGNRQTFLKTLHAQGMTEADHRKDVTEHLILTFMRQRFKQEHEKEFDASLPLREQPLYRRWIEELRNKTFVQIFFSDGSTGGQSQTVSVDERWPGIIIPQFRHIDTDLAVVLADLEKMLAAGEGKGLKIVLQDTLPDGKTNQPVSINFLKTSPLSILTLLSTLTGYQVRIDGATAYFYRAGGDKTRLLTRETRTEADAGIKEDFFAAPGDAEQTDVTEQLRQKGLVFGEGSYAVWFPKLQKIVMRNTEEQHTALRDLFVERYKNAVAQMKARLDTIIIPECDFTDAKILDVLRHLQMEINRQQTDPKKSGPTILVQHSATGQPRSLVTLQLQNASLTAILEALQKSGNYKYVVEHYAIFIVPTEQDAPK